MAKSRRFRSLPKLSPKDAARLEYLLDAVTDIERLSDKAGFDFLSYLISLSRNEILDILNYQAPAQRGLPADGEASAHRQSGSTDPARSLIEAMANGVSGHRPEQAKV